MLDLPASAPLHSSLAGCPYCENFCYDHYLEVTLTLALTLT